jgi:guanyl-specific ribonuclease Sa
MHVTRGARKRQGMTLRLLLTAAWLALLVGCTARDGTISGVVPPIVSATPSALPQQTDQTLRVTIYDGQFVSTIYQEQAGATQLLLIAQGGPYLFEIDGLVNRRELAADTSTAIWYDVSSPGQYTMRAYSSTAAGASPDFASAVLDVRTVGGR